MLGARKRRKFVDVMVKANPQDGAGDRDGDAYGRVVSGSIAMARRIASVDHGGTPGTPPPIR